MTKEMIAKRFMLELEMGLFYEDKKDRLFIFSLENKHQMQILNEILEDAKYEYEFEYKFPKHYLFSNSLLEIDTISKSYHFEVLKFVIELMKNKSTHTINELPSYINDYKPEERGELPIYIGEDGYIISEE